MIFVFNYKLFSTGNSTVEPVKSLQVLCEQTSACEEKPLNYKWFDYTPIVLTVLGGEKLAFKVTQSSLSSDRRLMCEEKSEECPEIRLEDEMQCSYLDEKGKKSFFK